jgi:hypothetical protein
MARLLADRGLEVAEGAVSGAIVEDARRFRPDAIVLDLGDGTSKELRERVRAAAPGAKLILWARDETEMQIFDPGSAIPRWIGTAAPDALLSELSVDEAERRRE